MNKTFVDYNNKETIDGNTNDYIFVTKWLTPFEAIVVRILPIEYQGLKRGKIEILLEND